MERLTYFECGKWRLKIDRSLVSPVGNRAARIPAPRAKPPRDTANPAASHREAGAAPTA